MRQNLQWGFDLVMILSAYYQNFQIEAFSIPAESFRDNDLVKCKLKLRSYREIYIAAKQLFQSNKLDLLLKK